MLSRVFFIFLENHELAATFFRDCVCCFLKDTTPFVFSAVKLIVEVS